MNTQKNVNQRLAKLYKEESTDLSSEKVELGKVDDINKLLEKGEQQLKDAQNKIQLLRKELSNGLIIVNQNVPAQAKNALKTAEDLGADSIVQELKSIIDKSDRLTKDFLPLYKSIG